MVPEKMLSDGVLQQAAKKVQKLLSPVYQHPKNAITSFPNGLKKNSGITPTKVYLYH